MRILLEGVKFGFGPCAARAVVGKPAELIEAEAIASEFNR
jgi:hypothetical protein